MEHNFSLQVPHNALRYILFQRTDYQLISKNSFLMKAAKILPFFSYERMVTIESKLFERRIKRLYAADMNKEYLIIRSYLPEHVSSVLDIGCGIGGIDALLAAHYDFRDIYFYLHDKTKMDLKIHYGYEKTSSFYNSLLVAKDLLVMNGVSEDFIILSEANGDEILTQNKIDIIISLISWGFHYPIHVYLNRVRELLSQRGVLIVDVRKGTEGEKEIEKIFMETLVIFETESFIRIVARKPILHYT